MNRAHFVWCRKQRCLAKIAQKQKRNRFHSTSDFWTSDETTNQTHSSFRLLRTIRYSSANTRSLPKFEKWCNGSFRFHITFDYINQRKGQFLSNQRSAASYIHEDFCKSQKISMGLTEQMETMANQKLQALKFVTNPDIVQIRVDTKKLGLAVCALNHNVILGNSWHKKHDATFDLKKNKVVFMHHEKFVLLVEIARRYPELYSQNTTQTVIRNRAHAFPFS